MDIHKNRLWLTACLIVVISTLVACSSGKHPFLMVQICLGDESGLSDFKKDMRLLAAAEKMRFIDNSEATQKAFETTVNDLPRAGPVVNVGILGENGIGAVASDLNVPGYQVTLGFSEGSDPPRAREFAGRVVRMLKRRWQVFQVPPGKGAFPLRDCTGTASR